MRSLLDFTLTLSGNLRSHVKFNHCQDRIQRCDQCDYESSSAKRLATHKATMHPIRDEVPIPTPGVPEIQPRMRVEKESPRGAKGRVSAVVMEEEEEYRPGPKRKMKCSACSFSCSSE